MTKQETNGRAKLIAGIAVGLCVLLVGGFMSWLGITTARNSESNARQDALLINLQENQRAGSIEIKVELRAILAKIDGLPPRELTDSMASLKSQVMAIRDRLEKLEHR